MSEHGVSRREVLRALPAGLFGSVGIAAASRTGATGDRAQTSGSVSQKYKQADKIAADDGDPEDRFGQTVTMASETALIGAPRDEDPNGSRAGAVYVYDRDGKTWQKLAKLTPNDGDTEHLFGSAVELKHGYALVGAPGYGDRGAGAAYLFEGGDDEWTQQAKFVPDDTDAKDQFGAAVAVNKQYALVGAPDDEHPKGPDNESLPGAGSVYVFTQSDGTWRQKAKVAPDTIASGDQFGAAVALTKDVGIIGAPGANDDPESGSAYVYTVLGDPPVQQTTLTPKDGRPEGRFGASVALNNVARAAVVGAPGKGPGAAYMFATEGMDPRRGWEQRTRLTADSDNQREAFGVSVDLIGGRQLATVIVGAHHDQIDGGNEAGSAYLFDGEHGSWSQRAKLVPDDGDSFDSFGQSVVLRDDTALISAPTDEDPNGKPTSGSVYAFEEVRVRTGSGKDNGGGQGLPGFGLPAAVAGLGGGALWHRLRTADDE